MRTNHLFTATIILIIAFSSCTVYREINIEILRPNEISIPQESHILLAYRNFKFKADTSDTPIQEGAYNTDSLFAMSSIQSLAELFYDYRIASDLSILSYPDLEPETDKELVPLSSAQIRAISMENPSDYILILENLTYNFSSGTEYLLQEDIDKISFSGIWRLYNTNTRYLVKTFMLSDTLYWARSENKFSETPLQLGAMAVGGEMLAENIANAFITRWEASSRIIIIPPVQEFNMAAEMAAEHDWVSAMNIWNRFTPRRFGRLALPALYNTALAYEMLDDFDRAIGYIEQAHELALVYRDKREIQLVQNYRDILLQRQQEINKFETTGSQ